MTAPIDNPPSELDVVHDDEGTRFLLRRDGEHLGLIDYRIVDRGGNQVYDLHHTEVDPAVRGHGFAGVLVRGTLDELRKRGHEVVPSCWYVRDFIRANAEYAEMVATG